MVSLTEFQSRRARHWIDDVIAREGYLRVEELHIDEVVAGLARSDWFGAGIAVFRVAVDHLGRPAPTYA